LAPVAKLAGSPGRSGPLGQAAALDRAQGQAEGSQFVLERGLGPALGLQHARLQVGLPSQQIVVDRARHLRLSMKA
jgi:hypothetical protein